MTTKDFKYQTLKNTRSLLNSLFLGWHAINKNVSTDFSSAATEKKKASVFLPATHWTQLRLSHISDIFLHLSKISFKEKKKSFLWSHLPIILRDLCATWQSREQDQPIPAPWKNFSSGVSYTHPESKHYLDLGHPSLLCVDLTHLKLDQWNTSERRQNDALIHNLQFSLSHVVPCVT